MECGKECVFTVKIIESIVKIILMIFVCLALVSYIKCNDAFLKKMGNKNTKDVPIPARPEFPPVIPLNYQQFMNSYYPSKKQ